MKLDGKRAIICQFCGKRIKGTSGVYTKEYRIGEYHTHLGLYHPETGVIVA